MMLAPPPDDFGRVDWANAVEIEADEGSLVKSPDHPETVDVSYGPIPDSMNSVKEMNQIEKEISDFLYQSKSKDFREHADLKIYQHSDESIEAFNQRLLQAAREQRDEEVDKIQDKYETKFERIGDRIRREEFKLEEKKADLRHRKTAEIVGVAETIFSVFAGRRRRSISAVTTKSRMRRKASQSVESIEAELEDLQEDYLELEHELEDQLKAIQDKWDAIESEVEIHQVTPRRADVKVDGVSLVWQPTWVAPDGLRTSARG